MSQSVYAKIASSRQSWKIKELRTPKHNVILCVINIQHSNLVIEQRPDKTRTFVIVPKLI